MRTVNFNKNLVECEGLIKLRDYIRCAYKYILYIPIHIPTYYLCIIICYIINYEKFAHSCYQMNKKLKHTELLKLWTRRKGDIKSEYFKIVTYQISNLMKIRPVGAELFHAD
jgi:hypothetical protein